jgi:hypothetical protein
MVWRGAADWVLIILTSVATFVWAVDGYKRHRRRRPLSVPVRYRVGHFVGYPTDAPGQWGNWRHGWVTGDEGAVMFGRFLGFGLADVDMTTALANRTHPGRVAARTDRGWYEFESETPQGGLNTLLWSDPPSSGHPSAPRPTVEQPDPPVDTPN